MITQIRLGNFKGFQELQLTCRRLTLLTGVNSTGKTSILQALLLLRQSYQQGLLQKGKLALNGELVQIGTAGDALNEDADIETIELDIQLENTSRAVWQFGYDRAADVLTAKNAVPATEVFEDPLFCDGFHYLSADRLGSRTHFSMSDYLVREHRQLGPRGEFAAHFLNVYREDKLHSSHRRLHPKAVGTRLLDQVEAWLGEISPGVRLRLTPIEGVDILQMSYAFALEGSISSYYRPTNVGYGLTYTMAVIIALLSSLPGQLVLLENPESHLHPRAQARLGELLALAVADGVQVVAETHSDHVLNGLRLAVKNEKVSADAVAVHYFIRTGLDDGQPQQYVVSPILDKTGRFDRWPEGFFDEWENSLEGLLNSGESNT